MPGLTLQQLQAQGAKPAQPSQPGGLTLEQIIAQQHTPQAPDTSVGFGGTKILGEGLGLISSGKMLGQTSNQGQNVQNQLDSRLASGQITQAQHDQLSKGLQPDISGVMPARTSGDIVRGGIKAGTDLASLAVGGGGVSDVAEATLGGAIKQGAISGATSGALSGGLQGAGQGLESDKSLGGAVSGGLKGAAVGGAVGGAVGAVAPAIASAKSIAKDVSSKASDMIRGKPLSEILAMPESEVSKLNPSERKAWFDNQHEQISAKHEAINQNITKDLQSKSMASQAEAEQLQRQLATTARDKTLELRPKIIQAMGRQSATYRQLVSEDLAPHANVPVKTTDLNSYIDSRFADDPQKAASIKDRLGTTEKVNPLTDPTDKISKVKPETTLGELYQRTQALKQDIGSGATKGSRVFTPAEKTTDDAIHTLSSYMKENGVDLKNANQFWAKYAPVRDQIVSEAKPFNMANTKTKTFANTLARVAKGSDVNNENFIGHIEELTGGPIQKEVKDVVAKMSANEKTALANKMSTESAKIDNQMTRDSLLKKLGDKRYEIERQAKLRDSIKKVLKYAVPTVVGEEVIRRF